MSLSEIPCQPRIDEPSKPSPSSNASSSIDESGRVMCCHDPSRSVNLRSTSSAFDLRAHSSTVAGVAGGLLALRQVLLLFRHAVLPRVGWTTEIGPRKKPHDDLRREASLPPRTLPRDGRAGQR